MASSFPAVVVTGARQGGKTSHLAEAHAPDAHLWFYRDTHQLEVDFFVQRAGGIRAIEGKWAENPDAKSARALRSFASLRKDIPTTLTIVSPGEGHYPLDKDVMVENLYTVRATL